MLVQIAVAVTIELDSGKSGQSAPEVKRAFVGMSCLSSCLSMVNRKPVIMRYNDQVGECCRSLATGSGTPSDTQLIHFVELQRLAEETALVFGDDPMNDERPWIGSEWADLLVKAFKSRLQYLRGLFPRDGVCLPSIPVSVRQYLYSSAPSLPACLPRQEPINKFRHQPTQTFWRPNEFTNRLPRCHKILPRQISPAISRHNRARLNVGENFSRTRQLSS